MAKATTKKLKILSSLTGKTVTIKVPKDIWFNTTYKTRGALKIAKQVTLAQFLTTSNTTMQTTFIMMTEKELDAFEKFVKKHPDHTVIAYVNTTAAIKCLTDIVCTSSNALQIVESLPKDEKIIFAPDRNLGNYIKSLSGRDMLIWDGACHVHEEFSIEKMLELKEKHPNAKIIAHPECEQPVLILADHVGSTSSLLKFTDEDNAREYIVATESGILHQMIKKNPDKLFIPAPPKDSTCACNDCKYMKMISLKKIYSSLKYEQPEIILDNKIIKKAVKPIHRMLEISEKMGL